MSVLSAGHMSDRKSRIHPQLFGLYIGVAGILMMFAALTSAYIVRQAAGNWLEFRFPDQFFWSTAIILLSSVTLHLSYSSFVKGKEVAYKSLLLLSFCLGIGFVVTQYSGWMEMERIGVYLTGNPSGSFVYAISGLHAAHVLGGIAALLVAIAHAFGLRFKPTPARALRFKLVVHYWHFVDALWIYLLVFFILQK